MKQLVVFLLLIPFFAIACGKSKNPSLSDEELGKLENIPAQKGLCAEPEEEIESSDSAKVIPKGTGSGNSPWRLDYTKKEFVKKELNWSNYYKKAKFVKLTPPVLDQNSYSEKEKKVIADLLKENQLNFQKCTDNYILASDEFGLYCFNKEGEFEYTVEKRGIPDKIPKAMDMGGGMIMYMSSPDDKIPDGYLGRISVFQDQCLFTSMENEKGKLHLFDLKAHQMTANLNYPAGSMSKTLLISDKKYVAYSYIAYKECDYFSKIYNNDGMNIGQIRNDIPIVNAKGNVTNPDDPFLYLLNDQFYIRQSYNDTVFHLVSNQKLEPVYVLDFGDARLDAKTGATGDKSQKLIPYFWKESNQFILFSYTKNYDCPKNRQEGKVSFFHSYIDKSTHQIYQIPTSSTFPNDVLLKNTVEGSFPMFIEQIYFRDNRVYTSYSKKNLIKMMKHQDFSSLPADQQQRVKTESERLSEQEVLVMIME